MADSALSLGMVVGMDVSSDAGTGSGFVLGMVDRRMKAVWMDSLQG